MTNLDLFADKLLDGKVFFFAGSGISYESNLPSAYDILHHTAKAFLHKSSDIEIAELCNIQPEIFYEVVLSLTMTIDSLHLWQSLHPKTHNIFSVDSRPNLAHLFIVEQSHKSNLPIFTTNFDNMFELAADLLGIPYEIILPTIAPLATLSRNKLAICKVHGSIQNMNGEFTPQSLATTMTAITKINVPWLEYIASVMKKAHLCYVGYSGRDIDLFPHLRAYSQKKSALPIIWINRFTDCYSDIASKMCKAIRVEDIFPSEAFQQIIINRQLTSKAIKIAKINARIKSGKSETIQMLTVLSEELSKRVILSHDEQDFLYAQLKSKLGNYSEAITLLKHLNIRSNSLNMRHKHELLLGCSRLSHEVSKYQSCKTYAQRVLRSQKQSDFTDIDIELQARCLVSEALRMNVPADTYFQVKETFMLRLFCLYVLIHFIVTSLLNTISIYMRRTTFAELSPATQHELLEHKIRFWGFIQSRWIRKFKYKTIRNLFIPIWNRIRHECQIYGYAGGVANTGKYCFRLLPDHERANEAENIFGLMTYSTGKELSIRNLADLALERGSFGEAESLMCDLIKQAQKSGNRLNEAKGLLGLAKVKKEMNHTPLLNDAELKRLKLLFSEVEGRFWSKYFNYLQTEYIK